MTRTHCAILILLQSLDCLEKERQQQIKVFTRKQQHNATSFRGKMIRLQKIVMDMLLRLESFSQMMTINDRSG